MSANYIRKTGSFRATNAALTLDGDKVGFRPSMVKIVNESNGARFEWNDAMGDDTGLKVAADGTGTFLSSDGLTPTATGFTLAAVVDINDTSGASAEVLSFVALG